MYLIFKSLWSNANFMPLFKKKIISYQFYIKVYFFISLINGWLKKERSDNNKVTDLFLLKSNVYASRKNYGVLINNSLLFLHYDYNDLKLMHKLIWDKNYGKEWYLYGWLLLLIRHLLHSIIFFDLWQDSIKVIKC